MTQEKAENYDGEFKVQKYWCPVHGEIDAMNTMIILVDGKEVGRYCLLCFNELLNKEIGQVKELRENG